MKKIFFLFIVIVFLFSSCSFSHSVQSNPQISKTETIAEEIKCVPSYSVFSALSTNESAKIVTIDSTSVIVPILPTAELNQSLEEKLTDYINSFASSFLPLSIDFSTKENFKTKTYSFFVSDKAEQPGDLYMQFSYDTSTMLEKSVTDFMPIEKFESIMMSKYNIVPESVDSIEVCHNGINVYISNTPYFIEQDNFEFEKLFEVFYPDSYAPVTNTNEKYVALTFDDGPNPYTTTELLETLKKHDVKATFFMVGYNIKEYPNIVEKIFLDNHDIGIHSYKHSDYSTMKFDKVIEDIDKCSELVYSVIGKKPYLVRPPFGNINRKDIKTNDYFFVNWNVDPLDWKLDSPQKIAEEAIRHTKSGSIILLHDIYKSSCEAADIIIETLKNKGYRFVTLSEYFDLNNKKSDNNLHFFKEDYNVK